MDDLLQEFLAETREMLEAISGEIVAWEADPSDRARLDAIFRFVHTVKGSCGFLDLPRLARLSHAAEDVLADLRDGTRQADPTLVGAVLGIVDRIGELAEAIETGEGLSDEEDHRLIAALALGAPPPPAVVAAPASAPAPQRAVSRTIRLPIDLLDRMMGGVSDMVLARNELSRKLRETNCELAVEAAFERLSASVAEMRDAITRTRMQRIENIFATLPRLVRDVSAELGKQVALTVEGGDVELDREMLEMIRDPLLHILRNAVDHGIEASDARRRLGKPDIGRLRVSARQSGNQILIEVSDDGNGIDGDKLVARAIAVGILTPERGAVLGWQQKLQLIFEPGLSTANEVTEISGRGVGMDVVRANVERIGGLVDIDSKLRQGSRFTLRVPLTLTIIPALTVSVAGLRFAIPRAAIEEIVRARGEQIAVSDLGGALLATIRGRRLPLVSMAALIGQAPEVPPEQMILVVLKPAGTGPYALGVDAVHDHEELVVKPAAPPVMATGIYAGTTLPDNGRPMLLLDPAGIADAGGVAAEQSAPAPVEAQAVPESEPVATLLFRELGGMDRAISLSLIERIEDVSMREVRFSGGRWRVTLSDEVVPLLGCDPPPDREMLRLLRISDGQVQLAYAIEEVTDIISLTARAVPAAAPGPVAGVVLIEGRQVELLDPHWLFMQAVSSAAAPNRPLVLLRDAGDRWMREMLRPLIESAGYRVGSESDTGLGAADVVIVSADAETVPASGTAAVIRLRTSPVGEGVYRYDREALLTALREGVAR